MRTLAGLLATGLLLSASAAVADEPAQACVAELLFEHRTGELGLARVVGDQKARFQPAPKVCATGDKRCLGRQYVVKGDVVVTGARRGGFTCAFFPNKTGGADGWMPSSQLAVLPTTGTGGGWAGDWTRDDWASLRLTAAGAEIAVAGEAMWQGATPGAVHTGEIEGRARPVGDTLKVGDDNCKATLRRLGPYLAVSENGGCGGMNVSFTGVYRRGR